MTVPRQHYHLKVKIQSIWLSHNVDLKIQGLSLTKNKGIRAIKYFTNFT